MVKVVIRKAPSGMKPDMECQFRVDDKPKAYAYGDRVAIGKLAGELKVWVYNNTSGHEVSGMFYPEAVKIESGETYVHSESSLNFHTLFVFSHEQRVGGSSMWQRMSLSEFLDQLDEK